MKAELILENIGSHRDIRKYSINSGKITIFEGSNSSGKSTIIKSIAAILSSPINSNPLKTEANNYGILPLDNKESPIVNIFENEANITLRYKDLNLIANLYKDGTIKTNFPESFQSNENFLYACMLVKNSKIQRNLASGDDNFQWIVSEMSFASKYEQLKETEDMLIRLINAAKNSLIDIEKRIGRFINENKEFKQNLNKYTLELNIVKKEIDNLPPSDNPQLKALKSQHKELLNDINISKTRIDGKNQEAKVKKEDLDKISSDIDSISIEIDRINKKMKNLKEEIEYIQNIDEDLQYKNIMENQEVVKKIIADLSENKKLRELHNLILNSRHESDTCPLCGSKIPTNKETSSKKLKEINKNIEALTKRKSELENEIKTSDNLIKKKKTLKEKEQELKDERKKTDRKYKDKDEIGNKTTEIENDLRGIEDNILREEKILKDVQIKAKEISNKIKTIEKEDKENSEIYNKRDNLLNEIQKLEGKIEKNTDSIKEASSIDLFGIKIPIEKANDIINNLSNNLEEVELYLNEKINEQRTGAGKNFNATIKNVIKDLHLEDFEDIFINLEDYRLKVVRTGGKPQPLGALGGAERGIIGGILQISCKQTYLKEIPFFIGDDIILEFDPEMSRTFIEYLKKIAVKDDLFIILTKISNNKELTQLEI